jgi:arylformamidase
MPDTQDSGRIVYRGYTQAQLDAQYNQQSLVAHPGGYKQRKIEESARVRAKLGGLRDIAYGPSRHETLDVFTAAEPGGPILVFIHGGAWKAGHKDEVSFVAEHFVDAGAHCVTVNFALVPEVRLAEQVRQAAAAIAWVWRNAMRFGGDPERIFVTGHSSGGHVTGMMMVTEWQREFGVPDDVLKGAAPFSGMFDLEPVQLSWRNSYLALTRAEALILSPIRRIPDRPMQLIIGYGTGELDEFQRQSAEFAAAWRACNYPCRELVLSGLNHFEVQQLYNQPDSVIVAAITEMMGLTVPERVGR